MAYGGLLCALTPRPQVWFLFNLICGLAVVLFFGCWLYCCFFYPPCIPGYGGYRGGIRVLYFQIVFIGE